MLQEQWAATNTMLINFKQTFMKGMSHQSQAPHHAASWGPMHPYYFPPPPAPSDWAAQRSSNLSTTQAQPTNPFDQTPRVLYQSDSGEPSDKKQYFFSCNLFY